MMHSKNSRPALLRCGLLLIAAALIFGTLSASAAEDREVIERFSANVIDIDTGRTGIVNIGVYEWTTDEERQFIANTLRDGGSKAVYEYLSKQEEKAFVKFPKTLGGQMRYAYQVVIEDKRYIVIATDRPIGGMEAMRNTRSKDKNFTLITLVLDSETGKGEGKAVLGAEISLDPKTSQLKIEIMSGNPTKLLNAKTKKVKE